MNLTYFKRYRMEMELTDRDCDVVLPAGYRLLAWDASLMDAYAVTKYNSFRDEIDANVFPCLGNLEGCRRLMKQIADKPGFIPQATWLIAYAPDDDAQREYCGTIQGIRDHKGNGSIQNLAVTPEHRNCGLGTALLKRSLAGFAEAGLQHASLEATAHNLGAIRLYQRVGFIIIRTVYKAVEPVRV